MSQYLIRWSELPVKINGDPSTTPLKTPQVVDGSLRLVLVKTGAELAQRTVCLWPVSMFHTETSLLDCEAEIKYDGSVGWQATFLIHESDGCLISVIGSRKRKSQQMCLPPLVPVANQEPVGSAQMVVITP